MHTDSGEELKRVVGVSGLAASVVNLTIGVGIYALPGIIAFQLGPAGILGYILCAVMFTTIILCYMEIGSRVKSSGGSYAYVEAAFGPLAGFIINWLMFFGWGIIADAAVMNIIVDSFTAVIPEFTNPIMRVLLMFFLISIIAFVNVLDAKKSVQFVQLVTLIKLVPLLAVIVFGISHVNTDNLQIKQMPSLQAFGDTALILFFAFAGFETTLNVSGEIKNSKRTIPLGILAGGIIVLVIYLCIQTITAGVLGPEVSEFKDAPLAAIATKFGGSISGILLLTAAFVSGFGLLLGDVLASPRLLYAGAKDGLFPKFLGKVHPRFKTPYLAIITYAGLIFIFSITGGFKQLAILASGTLLVIYLAVVMAMIKLRMKKNESDEKTFRVPGGLTIPLIAIAAILYVMSNLNSREVISIAIFIAIVSVIYFLMRKWKNNILLPAAEIKTVNELP